MVDSQKLDSPTQQLFREIKTTAERSKPKAPEPRRCERMGRDTTNWQERIKQGLAGGPAVSQVRLDEDHLTDDHARSCSKAHEWAKAQQME